MGINGKLFLEYLMSEQGKLNALRSLKLGINNTIEMASFMGITARESSSVKEIAEKMDEFVSFYEINKRFKMTAEMIHMQSLSQTEGRSKVMFHCTKGHDLTFYVPPDDLGIRIVRKHDDGEEPNQPLRCDDFENVGFEDREKDCSVCNYCIATEVDP